MGMSILTSNATVLCGHAGSGSHIPTVVRVTIGGNPPVVASDSHIVAGCSLSGSGGPFCTVLSWTVPAVRVKVMGQAVLTATSLPMGVGPGTVVAGQARVTAT